MPPIVTAADLKRITAACATVDECGPKYRLAAGGRRIRTTGPPVNRDGVFRDHPDQPPPLLLPENQARGTEGSNPLPSSRESATNSDHPVPGVLQHDFQAENEAPRRQTLCDTDRNRAGARDSLSPDHKSTTAQFLSGSMS